MKARCPKCGATYELAEDELGGQTVAFLTCLRCGDTFFFDRAFAELAAADARPPRDAVQETVEVTIRRELLQPDDTQVAADAGRLATLEGAADALRLRGLDPAAYPPRGELTLYVVGGADKGLYFQIAGEAVTVGRAKGGILIHDPEASRQHARVERYEVGTFVLRDLRSTNGTFVNDAPIHHWKLRDTDLIRVGRTVLLVRLGKPPAGGNPPEGPR